jgi:ABC-2 type transport system ATP-binding protein
VTPAPEQLAAARSLEPLYERRLFGRSSFIFDGVERDRLAPLGEVRTPSLSDLFVALMGGEHATAQEAAA